MSMAADLSVGDPVVHPQHGPGTVAATDTVDLGAGPIAYVTIEIEGGLTVKVPAGSLAEVGIRDPVTTQRAEEVLGVLTLPADADPGHRVRRRRDADKLASGQLLQCAEVVRDLSAITAEHDKGGSHGDRQMLLSAREQLAAELAIVLDVPVTDALTRIDDALAGGAATAA